MRGFRDRKGGDDADEEMEDGDLMGGGGDTGGDIGTVTVTDASASC